MYRREKDQQKGTDKSKKRERKRQIKRKEREMRNKTNKLMRNYERRKQLKRLWNEHLRGKARGKVKN